jgi:hypothetical protein
VRRVRALSCLKSGTETRSVIWDCQNAVALARCSTSYLGGHPLSRSRPSARLRLRLWRPRPRLWLLGTAAALAVGFSASGCTSEPALPHVDFPSATSAPSIGAVVQVTPAASYTGYAPPLNGITAQFSGIAANATLTFPMNPMTFTLTLVNTTSFPFQNIQPLIVLGQCTCNPTHYDLTPAVDMHYWDVKTNAWLKMAPGELGSGLTYSWAPQTGSINLGPHATISYKYEMALGDTRRELGLVNGTGSLTAYILQMPQRSRLSVGVDPDASVPLTYTFK